MMKRIAIAMACLMISSAMLSGQQKPVVEMEDPHPTPVTVWDNVKATSFGWGTIDMKYKKDDVPTLAKSLTLYGWRGERGPSAAAASLEIICEEIYGNGDLLLQRRAGTWTIAVLWCQPYRALGRPAYSGSKPTSESYF